MEVAWGMGRVGGRGGGGGGGSGGGGTGGGGDGDGGGLEERVRARDTICRDASVIVVDGTEMI